MFNRRSFLKYTGATTLTLFAFDKFGMRRAIAAAIPGGSLDPTGLPKYATPLLIPPAMPRAGFLFSRTGLIDYYEISVKQFQQQILPAGWGSTTVWGYGPKRALSPWAPRIYNAPSLTIEANHGIPVRIKWINELTDADGNYLPHLLPVDPTLHWANPPGGDAGRDMRPAFEQTPGRYTGPVPIVTHVHGAVGVGDESDGYAESWFLPNAANLPAGHATKGTWYDFFAAKAKAKFGVDWGPGFATFQYPNLDRAGTKWYHDHTAGMTRLNVYAGPAGFYNVRGGPDGDSRARDRRSGRRAFLPRPAPNELTQFFPNVQYREIPIAIQDRSFNSDGSLFYPDTRAFFDRYAGPFIPFTDISPIWNPEFFGNAIMVNGNTWPYLNVEQQRYRLRFLNGCQARFLILDFSAIPGVDVWQIGNEGGFLAAPVQITSLALGGRLLMGPAERADLIVDFANVPASAAGYNLLNVGPDEPFGGGVLGVDFQAADPFTTGQIMQFRVAPRVGEDFTTPPRHLVLPAVATLPEPVLTRPLALLEEMSADAADTPAETRLGTVSGDPNSAGGTWTSLKFGDAVTENPELGSTEVWEFYNATADAHPIHVHEVLFEVLNRQAIVIDEAAKTVQVLAGSTPRPPEPWETGFKDTVIAYPGEVTRIKAQFDTPGQYVWHCHIVEHEDNEMMRPYRIGPAQPEQPR
jgi:spore coat protein A, manganese oxidase